MQKVEFKAYLQNSDSSIKEIRRFKVDLRAKYDFKYLCDILKHFFPEIRDKDFSVSWMDKDMDKILITSDEELEVATQFVQSDVQKLFIKLHLQKQEMPNIKKEGVVHFNICCDHCDQDIVGFRYKCIQCDNYDLCSECEALGLHSSHYMIRMPRPLQWSSYHGRRLLHHMRKFLKKDGTHLCKEDIPDECPIKESRCHETPNFNLSPWLDAFAPFLFAFNEKKTDAQPANNAGPSKEMPKQKIKKESFLDLDIDMEISSDNSNASQSKVEKKEESKENVSTVENPVKKVSEEENKLNANTDDKAFMSNAKSVMSPEPPVKNTATADEWTIVDKNEASDISHASSVSSNLGETSEKHDSSSATSAAKDSSSNQTIYPPLPKEEEKVYHPNPKIRAATEAMIKMGFSNKGGLLTYLLEAEDCNINKVLDLLQASYK